MELSEIANLPEDVRLRLAQTIKNSGNDFQLPILSQWNYEPCSRHNTIEEGALDNCLKCGIALRKHQRVGVAYGFVAKNVLIADQTGIGKSSQLAGIISLALEAGEITGDRKILMIVNAPSILPWRDELKRMLPDVKVLVHTGIKSKRMRALREKQWEICLISPQTFNLDLSLFKPLDIYFVACDDVEPVISPNSLTYKTISEICPKAERICIVSATPINKKLQDIFYILYLLGAQSVLGDPGKFERRYVQYSYTQVYSGRLNRNVAQKKVIGYKNLPELIEKIDPFVIRRTAADLDDVTIPFVVPNHVMLEMTKPQQDLYEQLRQGVIKILKEDGSRITKTKSNNLWMLGQQICGGLSVLGMADGPNTSCKMDWIERMLTGDLEGEKVFIYAKFKNSVRSLQNRLDNLGIKYGTIWGEDKSKEARLATQKSFWDDAECSVLLGTRAASASLNLQVAQHTIAMDTELSPRVMTQILGRTGRIGSKFSHIYFHSLLCVDSQEERYIKQLQKEAAISDVVLDGSASELYNGSLSNEQLLRLISG